MSGQAKINKLAVSGVRAFNPDHSEVIKFFTPLTLIVGLNGSGKTTIIECLKYIFTGDLPPNSKGGAFVHDPTLVGEKEVKGQVRATFDASDGNEWSAIRSMQLTVKKTTRTFKTLEAHLSCKRDGERSSISTRVADLDAMIPSLLGVSRAVIDNVIFCHQEDSLWPMSEPSTLKKKFDEIFEAQKYTKAIDNIKVLRKKQREQLAQLEIHERHAKEDKTRGQKAEKRIDILSREILEARQKMEEIHVQMEEAGRQSKEAYDKATQFIGKVEELKSKRSNLSSKDDIIKDLREHMEHLQESDEELRRMNDQYAERVGQYQAESDTKRQQWHDIGKRIDESRAEDGRKTAELGRLQAQKDSYDRQLVNRESLVKESARRHNIRGYDHDLDHEQIMNFIDRIAKMAKDQNSALDKAKREAQEQMNQAQSKLDKLREQRSAIQQRRENAKNQITSNDKRSTELRRQMDRLDVDEGRQAAIQSSVHEINSQLETAKKSLEETNWGAQISDGQAAVASLETKSEELHKELMSAVEQASSLSDLNRLKKTIKETRLRLDTNKRTQVSRLNEIVGLNWSDDNLEELFDSALASRASSLKDAELQRDGTSRELEQMSVKLKSLRDDMQKFEKEKVKTSKTVCGAIKKNDPAQYEEELQALQSEREDVALDANSTKSAEKWWKTIEQTFQEKKMCRVCMRSFAEKEDTSRFQAKIKSSLEKAKDDVFAGTMKEMDAEIATFKAAGASFDRWKRLTQVDIPEAAKAIEQAEPRLKTLQNALEEHDELVSKRSREKQDAESMSKAVRTIVQDAALLKSTENEIAQVTQRHSEGQQMRTPDEINDDSSSVQEQLRSARTGLSKVQSDRDRANGEVSRLEIELRDSKSKLQTILGQLKEKSSMAGQIAELSTANDDQRTKLREYNTETDELMPLIRQTEAQLEDIRQRRDEKERNLRDEASAMTNTRDRLEHADKEIQAYLQQGGPHQLTQKEAEIEEVRQDQARLVEEQSGMTKDINELQRQQGRHEETKRQIVDNLRFRGHLRDLETLKQEIEVLEHENAEADRLFYEMEGEKWGEKRYKLATEQAGIMGATKSKDSEFERLTAEWETDGKGAAAKYAEARIRKETTKAAVEDLGRYGGALDKAIMKFHTLKMEQINRSIEELWRRTYQGTDVDTVLIRSDHEGGTGNKSYNYRVCMVKQDAEMDMRGRCSAGQKVLASIIIRLALAECFGSNCGMIALDEPTTNLDAENIRALAESLHVIIENRKAQKNFQLIVITHDENFLRDMHCADHADRYYRVFRGKDQKSEIESQRIADVV